MRRVRVLFAIAALWSVAARAQTVEDGIMLTKGTLFAGQIYSHDDWTEYWEGELKRANGNIGTLTTQSNHWFGNYGVSDPLNIMGSVRTPDPKAQVEAANETANKAARLELRYRYDNNVSQLMRRSDHWPFIQHGVPGIWIFTGLHPDYHTVNDDPERINYVKMEKILRLVHQMSWTLAQQDARPKMLPRTGLAKSN